MAGIRLRHAVFDEPEVVRTAIALGIPPLHAVGCFARLWSWADLHLRDLPNGRTMMHASFFDHLVHHEGFIAAASIAAPHWVCLEASGVRLLNLEKHNGATAKEQMDAARRKQKQRDRERDAGHRPPKLKAAPTPVVYPEWLPMPEWLQFVAARKQMRKPMTDQAKALTIKDLEKYRGLGHDPKELLEVATKRGWQGIYPENGRNGHAQPEPTREEMDAALEHERWMRRP